MKKMDKKVLKYMVLKIWWDKGTKNFNLIVNKMLMNIFLFFYKNYKKLNDPFLYKKVLNYLNILWSKK